MYSPYKFVRVILLLMCLAASADAGGVSSSGEVSSARLRWRTGAVQIAISSSLLKPNSNIKSDSDVIGAIRASMLAWERVAGIDLQEIFTDKLNVSPAGNVGDGVSLITIAQTPENLLLFAKNPESVSATTRVFFNRKGPITEADIVLNPYQQFSTDGTIGTFDLESTLTHEIGHLLGLDHSTVLSATMHENYGMNGVYGLQNFGSRTLANADVWAIRELYGPRNEDAECCGLINGRITLPNGRPARNADVWAEDAETGRVTAFVLTTSDGSFRFDGLPAGTYSLFSQRSQRSKNIFPSQKLGEVAVEKGATVPFAKKLLGGTRNLDLKYLGFNGQLSELAVPLNAGKTYTIYLGGKNLDSKRLSFGFSSPFLKVTPNTIASHDYGSDISVISFEVRVDKLAQPGEYTVFVESENGSRGFLVGGLTVEEFVNPWSNSIFENN